MTTIRTDLSVDWTDRAGTEAKVRTKIKRLLRRHRDQLPLMPVPTNGGGDQATLDPVNYFADLIVDRRRRCIDTGLRLATGCSTRHRTKRHGITDVNGSFRAAKRRRLLPPRVKRPGARYRRTNSKRPSPVEAREPYVRRSPRQQGRMSIQAGPHGSQAFRVGGPAAWQTPKGRHRGQAAPFSSAIAVQPARGVPAAGPFHQVLHSDTSICWLPTFEPFKAELRARMRLDRLRKPTSGPSGVRQSRRSVEARRQRQRGVETPGAGRLRTLATHRAHQ